MHIELHVGEQNHEKTIASALLVLASALLALAGPLLVLATVVVHCKCLLMPG